MTAAVPSYSCSCSGSTIETHKSRHRGNHAQTHAHAAVDRTSNLLFTNKTQRRYKTNRTKLPYLELPYKATWRSMYVCVERIIKNRDIYKWKKKKKTCFFFPSPSQAKAQKLPPSSTHSTHTTQLPLPPSFHLGRPAHCMGCCVTWTFPVPQQK